MNRYAGMVSSDWSQCLSPSGPYDAFIFHFPQIEPELKAIFRRYTANTISLRQAIRQVQALLPAPLSKAQMDHYLEAQFEAYGGVDKLIRWCREHRVLFMINTTGLMGYFQRALHAQSLPVFDVLSAHPMLRFDGGGRDPELMLDLLEIDDKPANTAVVAERFGIAPENIVIMGDSGGDGPHFVWGAANGATLIGSMTKPSLDKYCRDRGIAIDHHFGHTYAETETVSVEKERAYDFQALIDVIEEKTKPGG